MDRRNRVHIVQWLRRCWPVRTSVLHGMVPERFGRDAFLYSLCGMVSTKPYWCRATNGHAPMFEPDGPDEARCQRCLRSVVLAERTTPHAKCA